MKILVTDQFLELDDVSMQNIFMHELSHYKKKDNIVNFILIILKALYWINPIVYIMFKDIRNNMEYATDEMAIDKMNIGIYNRFAVRSAGGHDDMPQKGRNPRIRKKNRR